jgi:formate dehydrogenase gamma subunit
MTRSAGNGRRFLRWTRVERWQHWIMAASFILLVVTGFALKYPESWWAEPFSGIETRFQTRGALHRLAATLFTAVAVFHLGYLVLSARGRELLRAMLPASRDVSDVRHNLGWLSGRRNDPPLYEHFSYAEKAEYWALVWGTIVMGLTGAGLWFEGVTLTFLPLRAIEIFTTIHLYEAWLATLAIVVWHFYAVIFNPEVYPLNTSMITGFISEHHMRVEHGGELLRLEGLEKANTTVFANEVAAGPKAEPETAPAETEILRLL